MQMSDATGEVRLSVCESRLMLALRDTFTSSVNLLSELLQNCRRAGATQIEVIATPDSQYLEVRDNGCGVADFEALLKVAMSGWDADTIERESAFGIGMVSCLFGAMRLEVESCGLRLAANTADILAFKPVSLEASAWSVGTRVCLYGVKQRFELRAVESMVRGFPVPILFNGVNLARAECDDEGFIDCEIGRVKLPARPTLHWSAFLQGFHIAKDRHSYLDGGAIIHLDGSFRGRVPDRSCLVDNEAATARITACLSRLWCKWFGERKAAGDEAVLLGNAAMLREIGASWMLNDVQTLPSGVLQPYESSDFIDAGFLTRRRAESSPAMSRSQCEALVLVMPDVIDRDELDELRGMFGDRDAADAELAATFNLWQYLARIGACRIENPDLLDSNHWLFSLANVVRDSFEPVSVLVGERSVRFGASGHCFDDAFIATTSIQIRGFKGVVDASTSFALVPDDDGEYTLALTKMSDTGTAIRMYSDYCQDERLMDDWLSEDESSLDTEIAAAIDDNSAAFLVTALEGFRYGSMRSKVKGRRFMVSFDEHGDVRVELSVDEVPA